MPTNISWAEESWNPITGCTKISPGCKNCYAERMSKRLAGRFGYSADEPFRVTLHSDKMDQPLHWKKPRRIFVSSMGDLFHKDVPFEWIDRIWRRMDATAQHTYLVLTKRPDRLLAYWQYREQRSLADAIPFSNVWLGVTAENQAMADERIPILLQIPATVRFVSIEPMLSPIHLEQPHLDLVIAGAESGPGRRRANVDWFRGLRDQCQEFDMPFFLKQMDIDGKLVHMPELDGKVWDEMPT